MKIVTYLSVVITIFLATIPLHSATRDEYAAAMEAYQKALTHAQQNLEGTIIICKAHAALQEATSHLNKLIAYWHEDKESTLRKKNALAWMSVPRTTSGEHFIQSLQAQLTAVQTIFGNALSNQCLAIENGEKNKQELLISLNKKQEEVASRDQQLSELQTIHKSTSKSLTETQKTLEHISQELEASRKEQEVATINEHATQLEHENMCAALDARYKKAQTECEAAHAALKKLHDEKESYDKVSDQQKAHIKKLEALVKEKEKIVKWQSKKAKEAKEELATLAMQLKEYENLKTEHQKLSQEKDALVTTQEKLSEEKDQLRAELAKNTQTIADLTQEIERIKAEFTKEKESLQTELASEKEKAAQRAATLTDEKNQLSHELATEKEKADSMLAAMQKEVKKSSLSIAIACNTLKSCLVDRTTTFAHLQEIIDTQIDPQVKKLTTVVG